MAARAMLPASPDMMTPDTDSVTLNEKLPVDHHDDTEKDVKFWLIFVSLMLSVFVAALELTAVTNALPVIVHELHGGDFSWVGAAYSLASTAFLPMTGGLAEVRSLCPSQVPLKC